MESRWLFTGFDWRRYHDLSPRFREVGQAEVPDLDDLDGADDLLEECGPDAEPEDVRNALLVEFCTTGEGALFESGLPELLTWLRKQPSGEDPSEILGAMISAAPGVEEWFASEYGLVGLLTVEETCGLAQCAGRFRKKFSPPRRAGGLTALTRHFRTSGPAIEQLEELFEVVNEAAAEMLGFAAIRVG